MQQPGSPSLCNVFEIVARGLPYIDRRALSEAWYASLHMAEHERGAPPAISAAHAGSMASASGHCVLAAPSATHEVGAATACASQARLSRDRVLGVSLERCERRRPSLMLAARIAKAFTPAAARAGATFDIEYGGARVRVLMRCDSGNMRLFALCKPALRETVTRALDEARFLLASRGVRLSSAQTKAVRA